MENYVYMACDDIFQANEKWHTIMDWWKKKAIVRLNAVDTRMPLRTRKSKNNVAADRVFEMLYSFCDGQPNDVASAAIALIHTHNSLIHYPVLGESLLHLTLLSALAIVWHWACLTVFFLQWALTPNLIKTGKLTPKIKSVPARYSKCSSKSIKDRLGFIVCSNADCERSGKMPYW